MASRLEDSDFSHMGKNVQANDQKKEVSMDGKEKNIEEDKVKGGGKNGEGKTEDESKTDEGWKNDEEKKEDLNKFDFGVQIDEAKKEDAKETNEMKNDEAKKEDLEVINKMKINDGAKIDDVKAANETKKDIKEITVMKSDEEKKGDVTEINEVKKEDEKKEDEVKKNDMKTSETVMKEGEKKMNENIVASVADKEDEGVKGGEEKKKDEENEDNKAVKEENISQGVKERVVKIDENTKHAEGNGELNENEKKKDVEGEDVSSCNVDVSSLSLNEDSNLFSDLKENEKKALVELRSKIEEAINENKLFKPGKENEDAKDEGCKANSSIEEPQKDNEKSGEDQTEEKKLKSDETEESRDETQDAVERNKDIKLWGVPLLPSKGGNATDALLLKFLRARDFKVIDAFDMLRNTLHWRKENQMDSILGEDFGYDFCSTAYINGEDRQGHPVCYNVFGVLADDEMYNKTLGTEENRDKFVRWRLQLMEKGIQKLDFNRVSSLLQINDLKNTPGPSKKEVRLITKQVVGTLQDNYPEFVLKNIFINVPFWYYAFAAILSPFLTQRTKSKFVYARPSKVTETLLKYIDPEEIPVFYGGLKRDNDSDFSVEDRVKEILVKSSSTETIEIPAPEAGRLIVWDLVVLGWEVNYKEEFIPDDEKSYTIIVQKERKLGIQEGSIRNSFKNSEPGKIVLVIGNAAFKTKKPAFYRYKIKNSSS
ncbi:hypothetical protein DITRI_Ditri02bG0151200 [Diplodiscus trichospermus]